MSPGTYFKLRCPGCDTTVVVGVTFSAEVLRCVACEVPMLPDAKTQSVADGVQCPSCSFFGLITSDACPLCGEPFVTVQ
jgi:DNA-directed RNA polymerase subunit RPC12/RpoP